MPLNNGRLSQLINKKYLISFIWTKDITHPSPTTVHLRFGTAAVAIYIILVTGQSYTSVQH